MSVRRPCGGPATSAMGLRKTDWAEDEEEMRFPLGQVKFRNAPWAAGERTTAAPFPPSTVFLCC